MCSSLDLPSSFMHPLIEVLWDEVLGGSQEPSAGSRPVVPGHGVGVGDGIDVRGKSALISTSPGLRAL